MATLLMNAHNIVASCCGPAGNVFAKIFQKDDAEDQTDAAPAAAATSGAPAANKKFGFTDKQAKYEDVPWSKLPLSARKAAKAIGFDEATWDGKEWLDVEEKDWEELGDEERKACETLGWDEAAWDDKYSGRSWADLPKHVQRAAEKLEYNPEKWDDDWDVPAWEKGWEELSKEEQRCLHVLGYYVHTW